MHLIKETHVPMTQELVDELYALETLMQNPNPDPLVEYVVMRRSVTRALTIANILNAMEPMMTTKKLKFYTRRTK